MKVEYPKWLFQHGQPARLVNDADAHLQLGPGWYESPVDAEAAAGDIGTIAAVEDPSQPATAAPADLEAAERTALYAATVGDVVSRLGATPQATLEKVRRFESENPKGARKGIMAAIDKALAGLAPPPPEPEPEPVAPAVAVEAPVDPPAAPPVKE